MMFVFYYLCPLLFEVHLLLRVMMMPPNAFHLSTCNPTFRRNIGRRYHIFVFIFLVRKIAILHIPSGQTLRRDTLPLYVIVILVVCLHRRY